jgi:hypothetical protein
MLSPALDRPASTLPDPQAVLQQSQLVQQGYAQTQLGLEKPQHALSLRTRVQYIAARRPCLHSPEHGNFRVRMSDALQARDQYG